jgi:hypothetical protein
MSDGAVRARTKVVEVEAYRLTAEALSRPSAWPEWLLPRDVFRVRSAHDHKIAYVRTGAFSSSRIRVGGWIINTAGELSVCTPEEFEAGYEAVGEVALCCGACGSANVREPPECLLWCDDCHCFRYHSRGERAADPEDLEDRLARGLARSEGA